MSAVAAADGEDQTTKQVLAFGGNGFIGSEVLHKLLQSSPTVKYEVTLVSRGNWYFDSSTRIKPFIKQQIICDREDSDIDFCTDLVKYSKETKFIDIVLDFSSYKPEVLQDSLDLLVENGKIGVYFYISSDSVYEVCKRFDGEGALEEDAVRPDNEEERNELNENDSYGDAKLAGEEVLTNPQNKVPYVIFRLPDVIGPRDTTERWWTYQMWIDYFHFIKEPIHIPEDVSTLHTSYVYVKDVAQAVVLALDKGPVAWNKIYNLGLEKNFSLKEFLDDLSKELQVEPEFSYQGEFNLFPSVTRGSVNIQKAKSILGFSPTPWTDVLKETVQFYKEAMVKFPSERDDVVHQITKYILPRHRKGDFLKFIDDLSERMSNYGFQEGPKKTEL